MTLLDSGVWIDFFRPHSVRSLKQKIVPHVLHPSAHLAEPVVFEVTRNATQSEWARVTRQFGTLPLLNSPRDLWTCAASLGQACRAKGLTFGTLDLLIASVALEHRATVVTFDQDFNALAKIAGLSVKLLDRS